MKKILTLWASSFENSTYHIGEHQRLRRACTSVQFHQLLYAHLIHGTRGNFRQRAADLVPLDGISSPLLFAYGKSRFSHDVAHLRVRMTQKCIERYKMLRKYLLVQHLMTIFLACLFVLSHTPISAWGSVGVKLFLNIHPSPSPHWCLSGFSFILIFAAKWQIWRLSGFSFILIFATKWQIWLLSGFSFILIFATKQIAK